MLTLLLILLFVGVGLYLLNNVVPMDQSIKTIINVLVIVFAFLYMLQFFGVLPMHLPPLK